jgi:hypothetical protein
MDYVLNHLPDRDRDEIVNDLQHVSPVQHWGVWGAGSRNQPGTKNGWVNIKGDLDCQYRRLRWPGRALHPGDHEPPGRRAGFRAGANTLTQVAAILFQGRQIPVPDVSATP